MNEWTKKEWHHAVRLKFREQLTFLAIRLPSYDVPRLRERLLDFRRGNQLGSLEAHLLFGSFDLLIEAWMHPIVAKGISAQLAGALELSELPRTFLVEEGTKDLRELTAAQRALLDRVLSVHTLRAVQQEGSGHRLFRDLQDNGLIVDRAPYERETIRFFLAVTFDSPARAIVDRIHSEIHHYATNSPTLLGTRLYRGSGFCRIIVDSRVAPAHYFNIGSLVKVIGKIIEPFGGTIETYVSGETSPVLESDCRIHDSTLAANRGLDPVIESIVPEAYGIISEVADSVIRFLAQSAVGASLTEKGKRLVHDLLRPVLYADEASGGTPLFVVFFTQVEAYLRKSQGRFLSERGLDAKSIYQQAGVRNPAEKVTLGDLLRVYSEALASDGSVPRDLLGRWDRLIELRNNIYHGRYSLDNWEQTVTVLFDCHPRLDELIRRIGENGGEPVGLTYIGA